MVIINNISVNDDAVCSLEAFIRWYMENVDDGEYDIENDKNDDFTVLKDWCEENDHFIHDNELVINLKIAELSNKDIYFMMDESFLDFGGNSYIQSQICKFAEGLEDVEGDELDEIIIDMGYDFDFLDKSERMTIEDMIRDRI